MFTKGGAGLILDYTQIIDLILTFVVGLLFGLAIKKGVLAFVLAIVGFVIASYVGLSFIPKVSVSYEIQKALALGLAYAKDASSFGTVAISLTVIIFLIGLVLGLWKG